MRHAYHDNSGEVRVLTRKLTDHVASQAHTFRNATVANDREILARQQLFKRQVAQNGATRIVWSVFNLHEALRTSGNGGLADAQRRRLRSGVFTTLDGSAWQLELRPKSSRDFQAKLVVHAVRTPREERLAQVRRKLLFQPTIHRATVRDLQASGGSSFVKDAEEAFFVAGNAEQDTAEQLSHQYVRFISFAHSNAIANQFTQCLTVEVVMTPKVFHQSDFEAYTTNLHRRQQQRVSRNFLMDMEVGDDTTPYRGLINEGSTCYINSLLQTLYSMGQFRAAIYRLKPGDSQSGKTVRCLQRIFYNLQLKRESNRCYELIRALGYSDAQLKQQQDASEF